VSDILDRLKTALGDRYSIQRRVGVGGMATVYLAEDLKHGRPVAVKVLRPELAAAIGDDRFLQEIRVTASLRHPHILPLLDSGSAAGLLYYVMPFVAGESLRDRLDRERQLPIEDAVKIAAEVAGALGYAHENDVIHRDIKPENILLESGHAVVADFGVARAIDAAGGTRLTETGIAIGTPAYMSPEQATAESRLDGRSDIYSLGCVLYEMLAGEPPFAGPTAQAITARKLTESAPSVARLRDTAPEALVGTVQRMLAKLPADRFTTGSQVADALRRTSSLEPETLASARRYRAAATMQRATTLALWIVGVLAVIVVVLSAIAVRGWTDSDSAAGNRTTRLSVVLPQGVRILRLPGPAIALSPDGRTLVVVGAGPTGQHLFVRRLDALEAEAVPGTEGATSPFFSPDGESVGFYANGILKRVPTQGGTVTDVVAAPGEALGASWGPDDHIVFTTGYRSGLSRIPATGGTPEALTVLDTAAGELSHRFPEVLPSGHAVLFTVLTDSGWPVVAQDLDTGRRVHISGGDVARYARSGHLVLGDARGTSATLLAAPFDPLQLEQGQLRPVIDGVAARNSMVQYALSGNGTLAYVPGTSGTALVLVDTTGTERRVALDGETFAGPRFSPDGSQLAIAVVRNGQSDVWIYDMSGGVASRLTFEGGSFPAWTPDGAAMTFGTGPFLGAGEARGIRVKRADGRGTERQVAELEGTNWHMLSDWTAGGDTLVFNESREGIGGLDVSLAFRGARATLLHEAGVEFRGGRLSPDGRWLAYQSDEGGQPEVYLTTFPGIEGRWQVSLGGGTDPVWSGDGRELYYVNDERLMAATLEFAPTVRTVERRVVLDVFAPLWYGDYDVHPDGGLIALVRGSGTGEQREIVMVLNWFAELRSLTQR
jgi:Tol biopolymer transport system component